MRVRRKAKGRKLLEQVTRARRRLWSADELGLDGSDQWWTLAGDFLCCRDYAPWGAD